MQFQGEEKRRKFNPFTTQTVSEPAVNELSNIICGML